MLFRRSVLSCGLVVAAGALAFVGCSAKPENSPKIQKKFAEVDELKTSVEDNTQFLRTLAGDMTIIKEQLSSLQALNPESGSGKDLLARFDALEQRLNSIETGAGERIVASVPTSNSDAVSEVLANPENVSELATNKPTIQPVADKLIPVNQLSTRETPAKPKATTTKPAAKPEAKKETAKPAAASTKNVGSSSKGSYYTLQAGDTLFKVAAANGVSVAELEKENRIPAGAKVLKGQKIFIPKK